MLRRFTDGILKRDPTWPAASALPEPPWVSMLIEKERCLYFTGFLNNRQQPASDSFNQFSTPKELKNREIIDGNIQLRATFLTENWIYH